MKQTLRVIAFVFMCLGILAIDVFLWVMFIVAILMLAQTVGALPN